MKPPSGMGPRSRKPHSPKGLQYGIQQQQAQISFDKRAFTQLLNAYGIRMIHYRALPNPVGMADRGDSHGVLSANRSDDQFIYEEAGVVTAVFTNNSGDTSTNPLGALDHATAYITLPDHYDGKPNDPVLVSTWDRFFFKDVETRVIKKQYIESNASGVDRLQFPATYVESIVDANGTRYRQDEDFVLTPEGFVRWTTQRRPGWNPEIGKGVVYSVRYRYTPYFIVNKLIHEIRVSQITDPATFKRSLERMPYQIEVLREHIFQDVNRDPDNPKDDPRFQQAPPSGGMMGPR